MATSVIDRFIKDGSAAGMDRSLLAPATVHADISTKPYLLISPKGTTATGNVHTRGQFFAPPDIHGAQILIDGSNSTNQPHVLFSKAGGSLALYVGLDLIFRNVTDSPIRAPNTPLSLIHI